MAGEKNFFDLGKQLAEIGLSFSEIKKRISKMPESDRKGILIGFANATMNDKPEEAYRAGREAGDDVIVKSAIRKLLDSSLRQASRVALETEDENLMELVIEEASKKGDAVLVEMMRRGLKDKRLKDISKEFGFK